MMCTCGDEEEYHIDNEDQCMIADCGCKQFEENLEEELH